MKTMSYYIRVLLSRVAPAAPIDPSMSDEALEARRAKLRQRQQDMYDQMMKDGTHMFKRPTWIRGDSAVLREAGLVK